MELNARHSHLGRELLLLVYSLRGRVSILLVLGRFVLVSKHVEVILEDVDDFIGLESLLNSVSNLVNKLFKFSIELVVFSDSLLHTLHEIISIVESGGVDTTLKVSLSLEFLDLITSLETNFKHLSSLVRSLVLLVVGLQVEGGILSVLRHGLEVLRELSTGLSYAHLDERS